MLNNIIMGHNSTAPQTPASKMVKENIWAVVLYCITCSLEIYCYKLTIECLHKTYVIACYIQLHITNVLQRFAGLSNLLLESLSVF